MEKSYEKANVACVHIIFSNAGETHCWKRNTGTIAQAEAEL